VEGVYRCVIELDEPGALSALKTFVLEMKHGESRGQESALSSRDSILGMCTAIIQSILTRLDVRYSVKHLFLKVLSDSEISSVDECKFTSLKEKRYCVF